MAENKAVYLHDAAYARANGEIEQYHRSRKTNIDCKRAIESAVRENFDGMYLNMTPPSPLWSGSALNKSPMYWRRQSVTSIGTADFPVTTRRGRRPSQR